MARDGKQINIRIPHELHTQLVARAKASGRSLTSEVVMSLRVTLYPMTDANDWRAYVGSEIAKRINEARAVSGEIDPMDSMAGNS